MKHFFQQCSIVFGIFLFSAVLAPHLVMAAEKSALDYYPASEEEKGELLNWNLSTLIDPYEKGIYTNKAWDGRAKTALTNFALIRSRSADGTRVLAKSIGTNSSEAVLLGCNDPMVKYLKLRYATPPSKNSEKLAESYAEVDREMNASTYPSIRKFYADAHLLNHVSLMRSNLDMVVSLRKETMPRLISHLEATLHDKSVPVREAYEVANETLLLVSENTNNYKFAYDWIKPFFENWPNEYLTWLLKGRANVELAWIARGSGYADTITEEGEILFEGRLALAQECLEHAWIVGPKDPEIPHLMMTVMLGQGGGRKRIDLWFNRAMALNTNDYEACSSMLYYLEPKWYGSDEDQINFGRQCVSSSVWGGKVPLALVQAHDRINSRLDISKQADYWKDPQVWQDVSSSFDRFLQLNPDQTSYYQTYALYAYRAEHWQKFLDLLEKNNTINYKFFGGKDKFDEMVRVARQHIAEHAQESDSKK